jgi:hypothetical protein
MFDRLRAQLWHHWLFDLVQIVAIAILAYWWWHLPAPGYAIGALALLAAAMSLDAKMGSWHKVVWMLLIGASLLLEFRAIDKDRADYAKAEANRTIKEHQQFQSIANGIKETISNSNQQYATTMSRFNKTLNTITGDGSYCYFTFDLGGTPGLVHKGNYTLYDLHANFLDAKQSFIVGTEWLLGSPLVIGDFSAGSGRFIPGVNKPTDLNSKDQLKLIIFFAARNGSWREEYRGQYVNKEWVEAIKVIRDNGAPFTQKDNLIFEKTDKRFPRDKNGRVAWR